MKIPFTKAHGARNDFLLTWRDQLPEGLHDMASAAIAICDRHSSVGADGWLLVTSSDGDAQEEPSSGAIELWNSDGSRSEISGNGTRCAAALLVEAGLAGQDVKIATGVGRKHLQLLGSDKYELSFDTT